MKHTELQTSHHELTVLLSEHSEHNETLEQALITVYALSHKVSLVIKSSKTASKRMLLKTVFSNFELYAEKLSWTMVSVFSAMPKCDEYKKWLCSFDTIRKNHAKDAILIYRQLPDEIRETLQSDCDTSE